MARKLTKYAKILSAYLSDYATNRMHKAEVHYQFIQDKKQGHYQILRMAWARNVFKYEIVFHFEIKPDAKVWLWVNNTDIVVTEDLIALGIPQKDIVLGFHAPEVRAYTGYAVG